jgi:hypothetical protein
MGNLVSKYFRLFQKHYETGASNLDAVNNRIVVTFAILIVFIRGVTAARRGDGLRGHLVSA